MFPGNEATFSKLSVMLEENILVVVFCLIMLNLVDLKSCKKEA